MNAPVKTLLFLLSFALLSGCASLEEKALRQRERAHNARLATLREGSTRADLERLYPPRSRPKPFTTRFAGLPSPGYLPETHRLDDDFITRVQYAYARTSVMAGPLPRVAQGPSIGPSAIDALLYGDQRVRVYPRSSDRILHFPLQAERSAIPPAPPKRARTRRP